MEQVELVAIAEVRRICGISKSEIWRRIRASTFPQPVRLGPLTTRFDRREVLAWAEARLAERDAQAAERAEHRRSSASRDERSSGNVR
jgi:prophage regulatory protein